MLIWSPNLYMDSRVARKPSKYRRILEQRKLVRSVYCITLPVNRANNLDIYSSRELWFQYYQEQSMIVVGIARDREAAQKLAAQICLDTVARFGDITPDIIRSYFDVDEQSR